MRGLSREEAVRNGIANVELEGVFLTKKQKEVFEKLAKGELSHEDVEKIIENEIDQLRKNRPELFIQQKER